MALLQVDCFGTQRYGRQAFLQAANSRFAGNFDYTAHLQDAVQRMGWDGCEDARRFAQIQMLHAPAGPDISLDLKLILEATALEEFADSFWEERVDVHNTHELHLADFYAMGMDIHQASSFHLYISQPNGEVWPVGFVPVPVGFESDSDTDSYESVLSMP